MYPVWTEDERKAYLAEYTKIVDDFDVLESIAIESTYEVEDAFSDETTDYLLGEVVVAQASRSLQIPRLVARFVNAFMVDHPDQLCELSPLVHDYLITLRLKLESYCDDFFGLDKNLRSI